MLKSIINQFTQQHFNAQTKQDNLVSGHALSSFLLDFRMEPLLDRHTEKLGSPNDEEAQQQRINFRRPHP